MRTRHKNILTLLAAMLLAVGLYSCTEDPLFEERARVAEGLPARVMLDFRSEKSCVETRAAQDATYENRVNNLYVFIFNPAGEVHYRNFFTDDISYNGDYSKGSVMIETTSLNKVQMVCIANLSTESVSSGYDVKKIGHGVYNIAVRPRSLRNEDGRAYRGTLHAVHDDRLCLR